MWQPVSPTLTLGLRIRVHDPKADPQGAECALDGRGAVVAGHERGNFLGPTLLTNVTMDMDVWHEEIFAPVLVCLEARAAVLTQCLGWGRLSGLLPKVYTPDEI